MSPKTKQQKAASLRKRLQVLFIAVAIIPTLAICIVAVSVEYINGRQQVLNRLRTSGELIDLELVSWFKSVQGELSVPLREEFGYERVQTLLVLGDKAENYGFYSEALRNRLRIFVNQSVQLQTIDLINPDGMIILSTDKSRDRMDLPEISAVAAPMCVIKNGIAYVLTPIYNSDGQIIGHLTGGVKLDRITSILDASTSLGSTGKTYLITDTLAQKASSAGSLVSVELWDQQVKLIQDSTFGRNITNHLDGQAVYFDSQKNPVIGYSHWIPEMQMGLMIEQDFTTAYKALFLTLLVSIGAVILAVFLAAMVAWLTAKKIARPIENLASAANQMAHGHLEQTVPVDQMDEIGVLAQSFNSMTTQLSNLIIGLETRVEERTRDLKQRALQLETSAKVSREVSSILEIDELLVRVVELIHDNFGYYHTSINLMDEQTSQLTYTAGTDGKSTSGTLAQNEISRINQECLQTNQTILVKDTPQSEIRSELVIPLSVGDRSIGTLDVQSREANSFSQEDVLVLQSLGDQIAIAIENARLYQRNSELAVLEERNRLARDLHDSVSQSLYSLSLMAEGWKRLVKSGKQGNVEDYTDRFAEITQQALKEMRLLIYEMRTPALEQDGLIGTLRQRLDAVEQHAGIETAFIVDELFSLVAPIEQALYWIAQESLNNALKHSQANKVTIHLSKTQTHIFLDISDNGIGFDVNGPAGSYGLGLATMRERARKINAQLLIETTPGAGTTIRVQAPIVEGSTFVDEYLLKEREG